jgi:hypothetical protein
MRRELGELTAMQMDAADQGTTRDDAREHA